MSPQMTHVPIIKVLTKSGDNVYTMVHPQCNNKDHLHLTSIQTKTILNLKPKNLNQNCYADSIVLTIVASPYSRISLNWEKYLNLWSLSPLQNVLDACLEQ